MDERKRNLIAGWLDKASNHLLVAKQNVESYLRASDVIQAAQVCDELSVKAVMAMLEIEVPKTHGWCDKELRKIAEAIQGRSLLTRLREQNLGHIRLPRLLVLVNFWEQFYIQAKYGIEAGNLAPAQELFDQEEAKLAVAHAHECWNAADQIRNLNDEVLTVVVNG